MSERLSMRKIREVLRLAHGGRSQREIAIAVRASVGTVWNQLQRARAAGVTWDDAQQLTELTWGVLRDTADRLEGRRAFAEKHPPLYTGR